jgi:hypothetical protein
MRPSKQVIRADKYNVNAIDQINEQLQQTPRNYQEKLNTLASYLNDENADYIIETQNIIRDAIEQERDLKTQIDRLIKSSTIAEIRRGQDPTKSPLLADFPQILAEEAQETMDKHEQLLELDAKIAYNMLIITSSAQINTAKQSLKPH